MMDSKDLTYVSGGHRLIVNRKFKAAPLTVFTAWTVAEKIMQWWGPKDFTSPFCKIDLRVGGEYVFCMRSPHGDDYWCKGVYHQIVVPDKLIFYDSFCNSNGEIISASSVGLPQGWPSTLLITVTFSNDDGNTNLTLEHHGLPAEVLESCNSGWNESFDKLETILSFQS